MKTHEQKAVGHTPGPWIARTYPNARGEVSAIKIWSPDEFTGFQVCGIAPSDCSRNLATDCANARLIACAPDMLAALEACIGALDLARCYWHAERAGKVLTEFQPDLVAFEKALRASRAIIARARGGAS